MNDRWAFCDVCEEPYHEDASEAHEHQEERLAERRFLRIEEEGPDSPELPAANKGA